MRALRRTIVIALSVADAGTAAYLLLHLWNSGVVQGLVGSGLGGSVLYGILYLCSALLMLPTGVGNAGAGLLFGIPRGMLLVYPALMAGGMLSFWLSRSLARDWVAQRIATRPKFIAIDNAIARGGFKMVLLLRMSPVSPFGFLSYSLGLTRVAVRDYLLGTLLGSVPGTALYVYVGAALKSLGGPPASGDAASAVHRLVFWAGLSTTLFAVVMITRFARQELKRALLRTAEASAAELAA